MTSIATFLLILSSGAELSASSMASQPVVQEKVYGARRTLASTLGPLLGREGLRAFVGAASWLVESQEEDGRWPGPAERSVGTTAQALLVLLAGVEPPAREALARGLAWIDAQQSSMTGRIQFGEAVPDPVHQHALATWALLEASRLVEGRDGARVRKAVDALLAVRDPSGGFPMTWASSGSDDRTTAVAGLVLGIAAAWGESEDGAAEVGRAWLQRRAEQVIREPAVAPGARALVGASLLTTMFVRKGRADLAELRPLAEWLAANPTEPDGDLEDLVLGLHAVYQFGGPYLAAWEPSLADALSCVVESGRERGSLDPRSPRESRSSSTALVAMAAQVHVRWSVLVRR